MNPTQSSELAVRLASLFPKMTDVQVAHWADLFERFDFRIASREIVTFHDNNHEMSTPGLLALLYARSPHRDQRRAADVQDDLNRLQQIAAERAEVEALSDERRAEAVAAAMAAVPFLRKHKGSIDPRVNPVLRGLVVAWIKNPRQWLGAKLASMSPPDPQSPRSGQSCETAGHSTEKP